MVLDRTNTKFCPKSHEDQEQEEREDTIWLCEKNEAQDLRRRSCVFLNLIVGYYQVRAFATLTKQNEENEHITIMARARTRRQWKNEERLERDCSSLTRQRKNVRKESKVLRADRSPRRNRNDRAACQHPILQLRAIKPALAQKMISSHRLYVSPRFP